MHATGLQSAWAQKKDRFRAERLHNLVPFASNLRFQGCHYEPGQDTVRPTGFVPLPVSPGRQNKPKPKVWPTNESSGY